MRQLSAHEALRIARTLPGSEVRAFYEPESRAVQVVCVGAMLEHELSSYELGIVFAIGPALDGRYEPARLVHYPDFRWQTAVVGAFGAGIGEQVRAWAIQAYEEHLNDHEYRLHIFRVSPAGAQKVVEIERTLDRVREMRREFRVRVGAE